MNSMDRLEGIPIAGIREGSPAADLDIEPGDYLLTVNGRLPRDVLEYQFYTTDDVLDLTVKKADGEKKQYTVSKEFDVDLGLEFHDIVFDGMKKCENNCLFCFVDQQPKLRSSLHVKDDDYRYSFLYGNYISLTNLTERDWHTIVHMRLSPLYISVHTVDPDLRTELFSNPHAAGIKKQLKRLEAAGIRMHTQIVLCPGINDGEYLRESIDYLQTLHPAVRSVALVPVGLTRYRDHLPELRKYRREEAGKIIDYVEKIQNKLKAELGTRLVYAADDFYLTAGRGIPAAVTYEEYPQYENGVGMLRSFVSDFQRLAQNLPKKVNSVRKFTVVTGPAAFPFLAGISEQLNEVWGLEVEVASVPNTFWGEDLVDVSGLLTGRDILQVLKGRKDTGKILIPASALNRDNTMFLDGMSLSELTQELDRKPVPIEPKAEALVSEVLKGCEENASSSSHRWQT